MEEARARAAEAKHPEVFPGVQRLRLYQMISRVPGVLPWLIAVSALSSAGKETTA